MIPNTYVQQGDANQSEKRNSYLKEQGPETQYWIEEDARYFLHQALSSPVMNVLRKTVGAYIYDLQGNKFLDLHGNGVHNIGFSNPAVIAAVRRQLEEELAFTPRRYTNLPAVRFAKKLTEMAPEGLNRVLFCPGGSEAVEMAVLLAKQVTGKWKTISFWDNYHGTTYQAATIGGTEHFMVGQGPMVPGAFHVEFPNYYRNPWGLTDKEAIDELYLRQIEVIVQRHPDIACIMGTTITSTPVVPTQNYWQQVKAICERHDALLLFDEIVCGLGRSGKLFACEHYLTPDIVVLGKSLGGGLLPFAGIITHEKYNTLQHRSIGHFTHEKSPLCGAAGLAALEFIETQEVVENAARLGAYLQERLQELQEEFSIIGHVEGQGLHLALDLVTDRATQERAFDEAEKILYECMKRGLSFKLIDGNVITMRPALTITKDEADFIVDTLRAAFETIA